MNPNVHKWTCQRLCWTHTAQQLIRNAENLWREGKGTRPYKWQLTICEMQGVDLLKTLPIMYCSLWPKTCCP